MSYAELPDRDEFAPDAAILLGRTQVLCTQDGKEVWLPVTQVLDGNNRLAAAATLWEKLPDTGESNGKESPSPDTE